MLKPVREDYEESVLKNYALVDLPSIVSCLRAYRKQIDEP